MFLEFDDLLVRGEKQELFKRCFNRCHAAVNVSYEYEKTKAGSFRNFDERYHEQGMRRVDARRQAASRLFSHRVIRRVTSFRIARQEAASPLPIQDLYRLLACDETRNEMIFDDVLSALEARRSPIVITERKDHLQALAERLVRFAKNVIVLKGGMRAKEFKEATEALKSVPDNEERVVIATGRYLGEGFDDARLDTLFLTMPISWRGTLAQYAGRLHRFHAAKKEVLIYDYVDEREPILAKMATKREVGYRAIGYEITRAGELFARTLQTEDIRKLGV